MLAIAIASLDKNREETKVHWFVLGSYVSALWLLPTAYMIS